ncbi:MAG: type IV toxin-antitoxin system AbiEi family antitoxin domain-containing protein, partial [Aeromicrobium sp.]
MSWLTNDGHPFTTSQAAGLGLSPKNLRLHVQHGLVRRVFRGVYLDARVPDSRATRLRALALVTPDNAVISDETAAWVRGVEVFAPSRRHDFQPSMLVRHSGARVDRVGSRGRQAILEADDVEFIGGVHVTTAVRTASDLLRRMYRPYALAAGDAMARAGLVDVEQLKDYVARRKGYPGIVQARALAALVDPRAQSPGESWQRLRIHDAGFPPPEPQFEVIDPLGRSYFIDLPYPELLIGSEYDGRTFHTDEEHVLHD